MGRVIRFPSVLIDAAQAGADLETRREMLRSYLRHPTNAAAPEEYSVDGALDVVSQARRQATLLRAEAAALGEEIAALLLRKGS